MLTILAAGCENPVQLEPQEHHEPVAIRIYTEGKTALLSESIHTGETPEWTSPLTISLGAVEEIEIWFMADDGDEFSVADDLEFRVQMVFEPTGIAAFEDHGDHVTLAGVATGTTTATVQLYHGDHPDFEVRNLSVIVVP